MKIKLSNLLLVLIALVCISMVNVNALSSFPASIITKSEGTGLTLNNNHSLQIDTTHNANSEHYYPYFHVKNSSSGNIICTSGLGYNEPIPDLTCSKISWNSTEQARGVAYIINTIIGNGGNSSITNEQYYWSEIMINAYLGTYTPSDSSFMSYYVINAGAKIAGTGKTYNEILTGAREYASADYSTSISASKTSLTFTKNSDGYYYSEPVTITSTTSYQLSGISNSKFSYDKNGDVYTFKIKSSDIALGGSESFSISATNIGKTYYIAQNYSCGTGYQNVTISQTVAQTSTSNAITISGSVSKSTTEIKVAKVNNDGSLISGAKLQFQTESERNNGSEGQVITSTNGYTTISNLKSGVYYLSEKEAPAGYNLSKQVIKIEIDNEGNIKTDGTNSTGEIKIVNDLTQVEISKIDSKTKKQISGAILQVLDSKGNEILDAEGNVLYKWTTDGSKYVIEGLPAGKYQLKEIEAPTGYTLNKTVKTFEVKGDGNKTTVTMENEKIRVVISKISLVDSKLLKGATLQILDIDGNVVKYCKDKDGNNIECTWVSTDEPYEIEGMPNGKYYLVETIAPEGYHLNTEKIEFIIDGKNAIVEVEMENQLEVEVPNTLSSRSALLLAIAMFDIAFGIGIITYVKKNKIEKQ